MALTTRDNRAAAVVTFLPFGRIYPNPDAAAETDLDREQTAMAYRLAASAVSIPATLNDLTTIWCQDYQPVIHATDPGDDATLVALDRGNAFAYDNEDDMNTAYAKYISTEF
jgi:hypothetical protein